MPSSSSASTSPPLPPKKPAAKSTAALRDEHALLAAYETRPTRPKRSSSERSKEFRAKRKKYEGELQQEVDALRREVAELTMRRNIWQEKLVHMRSNVSGSLIKVVREYYLVFQHGLELNPENPKAKYQLDFLRRSMDEHVHVNDHIGIPTLVEMWRQYTISHANLFVEVGDVTLFGADDDPVVLLSTKVHTQLSRGMFEVMFPSTLDNQALIDKFIGKQVSYEARTFFRFNADGRIGFLDHDQGLLQALLDIAPSVQDALQLMTQFQCTPLSRWTIESSENSPSLDERVTVDAVEIRAVPTRGHKRQRAAGVSDARKPVAEPTIKVERSGSDAESDDSENERRKLSMNFLLS